MLRRASAVVKLLARVGEGFHPLFRYIDTGTDWRHGSTRRRGDVGTRFCCGALAVRATAMSSARFAVKH